MYELGDSRWYLLDKPKDQVAETVSFSGGREEGIEANAQREAGKILIAYFGSVLDLSEAPAASLF